MFVPEVFPRHIVRGPANTGALGSSKLVAVNADKIIFFIQNVNSMILKGAEHYVPHPLCVTFILCFFLYTKTSHKTLIGHILVIRN